MDRPNKVLGTEEEDKIRTCVLGNFIERRDSWRLRESRTELCAMSHSENVKGLC